MKYSLREKSHHHQDIDNIKLDTLKLIRELIQDHTDSFDLYIAEREAWKRNGVDGLNRQEQLLDEEEHYCTNCHRRCDCERDMSECDWCALCDAKVRRK